MAGDAEARVVLSGSRTRIVAAKGISPDHDQESARKFAAEIAKFHLLARIDGPFKVPGRLEFSADLLGYTRDYVEGATLESLMEHPSQSAVSDVGLRIIAILAALRRGPVLGSTFMRGEDYYRGLIRQAVDTVEDSLVKDAWIELASGLHVYPEVPMGFSHGDLAFDNIIVDRHGEYWLIDPLANPYETPWWDVGKVLQSTYCNWRELKAGHVTRPDVGMLDIAEAVMGEDRKTALFFLMLVLLRIIRHAPTQGQKQAILTEATRVGREYSD